MKLEELMMLKGFSFRALSEASEVSLSTIEYIVYGKTTKPYPKTMKAIAKVLDVEVNQIDEFAEAIKQRMGKEAALTTLTAKIVYDSAGFATTTEVPASVVVL